MGPTLQLKFRSASPLLLFACAVLIPYAALAEDEGILIDQRVRSSFQPWSAFLLSTNGVGTVRNTSAVVLPVEQSPGEYLAATVLDPMSLRSKLLSTFFLRGRDAAFAATPVRLLDISSEQSSPRQDFEARALDAEQRYQEQYQKMSQAESQLKGLRDRAMKLTGVDDIVRLQMELSRLKASEDQRASEQVRLRELIDLGRKIPEPEGIDELRQKLSVDLRDTAQVTALTDRLKVRKKQAARETLEEKLALVKEMSQFNREEIAKEILTLRARRKALERQGDAAGAEDALE